MADLDRSLTQQFDSFSDILASEKLSSLQLSAGNKQLTDSALVDAIGEEGLALAALGLAGHLDEKFRDTFSQKVGRDLSSVYNHVLKYAPSLLEHPRLGLLSQRLLSGPSQGEENDGDDSEDDLDEASTFDDIFSVRAFAMFIASGDSASFEMTPITRLEIFRAEKGGKLTLDLRTRDLAFLAQAVIGSLNKTLISVRSVKDKGLLDEDELNGVKSMIDEIARDSVTLSETAKFVESSSQL
jgi:hypothetical protein